ncbi:MAG: helix-turn-helix domain-containing protein [Terriglobales bacterium]
MAIGRITDRSCLGDGEQNKGTSTEEGFEPAPLAAAVGTSQQQIQRFETSVSAVKFAQAVRLCEALGTTMEKLFPESRTTLERYRRQPVTRLLQDRDAEKELLNAGIEVDPRVWVLKVELRGGVQFKYLVPVEAKKRLEHLLRNWDEEQTGPGKDCTFFCFDTSEYAVAINVEHLLFCHVLWEGAGVEVEHAADGEQNVRVWLAGQREPLEFGVEPDEPEPGDDDSGQFGWLMCDLDLPTSDAFFSFVDEDDEEAFFRKRDVALVEIPQWVLHRELLTDRETEEDEDRGDDEAEKIDDTDPATSDMKPN